MAHEPCDWNFGITLRMHELCFLTTYWLTFSLFHDYMLTKSLYQLSHDPHLFINDFTSTRFCFLSEGGLMVRWAACPCPAV